MNFNELSLGLGYKNKVGAPTKENFIQHMDDFGGAIKEGKEKDFKNQVDKNWEDIEHITLVIAKSEQIITDARIGVILLKNVTPLDAQNIFSRINSGGTQLKAEELLSAKPFWNDNFRCYVNLAPGYTCALVKEIRELWGNGMILGYDEKMVANHGFGLAFGAGIQFKEKFSLGYTLQYETACKSKCHLATIGFTF